MLKITFPIIAFALVILVTLAAGQEESEGFEDDEMQNWKPKNKDELKCFPKTFRWIDQRQTFGYRYRNPFNCSEYISCWREGSENGPISGPVIQPCPRDNVGTLVLDEKSQDCLRRHQTKKCKAIKEEHWPYGEKKLPNSVNEIKVFLIERKIFLQT